MIGIFTRTIKRHTAMTDTYYDEYSMRTTAENLGTLLLPHLVIDFTKENRNRPFGSLSFFIFFFFFFFFLNSVAFDFKFLRISLLKDV